MDLTNVEVLVIGVKRSGQAAAELLKKMGARVRLMDEQDAGPEERAFLDRSGLRLEKQAIENLGNPEVIVISPAVPADAPLLIEARARGIAVIGEVELAGFFLKGPIVGITGSNGKTTTTALVGHILRECKIDCAVGGNIGKAVATMVEDSTDKRWSVLELSSFQLETIYRFRANVAACLNVTPDHLDRHHTFEAYADAKARLFETQAIGDSAVLNYDDPTCREFFKRTKAEVFWFSSTQPVQNGISLEGEELLLNGRAFMDRHQIKLRGRHNLENAMAAAMMARLAGAPLADIGYAIASFPGVEHRIEFVRTVHGVEYFNDSKATNVDATLKALDAFAGNLWVILGGKDKGGSYEPLRNPLAAKAKGVLLIGQASGKIDTELSGAVPIVHSGKLDEAVRYAHKHARSGDIVLLAPACASFDQFDNFEHRGNTFKQLVLQLS